MTTRSERFLYSGYTFEQQQHFKELREQIRVNLQKEYEEMMKK